MTDTDPTEETSVPESWGYAISTDPVKRSDAASALSAAVAGYVDATSPSEEVVAHLAGGEKAAKAILAVTGGADDKVVVRVGGRATPGHAPAPGPDESLTVTVSVIELPDVETSDDAASAPVVVEGGSFLQVD